MIVITSPVAIKNEAALINAMFENGLELLHIRREDANVYETRKLIETINPVFHSFLVLHDNHELAAEYNIKRLHFKEAVRAIQTVEQLSSLHQRGIVLSTSVHDWESYQKLSPVFSYAFIGPVFNSISKTGYKAMVHTVKVYTNKGISRVAIGGITKENCISSLLKPFEDIAVLGTIWMSDTPLDEFKELQRIWNMRDR